MTEVYVARRSGILREPDGTLHRLYAGKTLAAAGHPAVTNSPDSWRPMTVDLDVDGEQQTPPVDGDDEQLAGITAELAEVSAERDRLVETLTTVVKVFDERGLLVDADRDREGWLVLTLTETLDELLDAEPAPEPAAGPAPEPAAELADPDTAEGRAAIREWAWAQGLDVAERGTLPKAIVEQYRAAHGVA